MNVLIVEDDVSAGAPLAEGLAAEGFDVTMVDGAENPVETAGALNPCAVLFDTSAPWRAGVRRLPRDAAHRPNRADPVPERTP